MVTVLDSFEDGDISEYSGDTTEFTVSTTDPYNGEDALEVTGEGALTRDVTVERGNSNHLPFQAWANGGTATYLGDAGILFGVQSLTGESSLNGYTATTNYGEGILIQRYDDGSVTDLVNNSDSDVETGYYHQVSLETWGSDGTITVAIYNEDGTQATSATVTDSTHGGGYIGIIGRNFGYTPYLDYITLPDAVFATPAPSNLHFNDTQTEDELALDWDAVSGANGYYVYRDQASGSTKSDYTQVADVTGPPYTDTPLEDGERYYYRVSSHD